MLKNEDKLDDLIVKYIINFFFGISILYIVGFLCLLVFKGISHTDKLNEILFYRNNIKELPFIFLFSLSFIIFLFKNFGIKISIIINSLLSFCLKLYISGYDILNSKEYSTCAGKYLDVFDLKKYFFISNISFYFVFISCLLLVTYKFIKFNKLRLKYFLYPFLITMFLYCFDLNNHKFVELDKNLEQVHLNKATLDIQIFPDINNLDKLPKYILSETKLSEDGKYYQKCNFFHDNGNTKPREILWQKFDDKFIVIKYLDAVFYISIDYLLLCDNRDYFKKDNRDPIYYNKSNSNPGYFRNARIPKYSIFSKEVDINSFALSIADDVKEIWLLVGNEYLYNYQFKWYGLFQEKAYKLNQKLSKNTQINVDQFNNPQKIYFIGESENYELNLEDK